jgi:hypothetical protein
LSNLASPAVISFARRGATYLIYSEDLFGEFVSGDMAGSLFE